MGPLQSIRDDTFKLIASPNDNVELYRWREDPEETTDVSDEYPEVTRDLLESLRAETGDVRTGAHGEEIESESLRKTLEHLGYR